MKTTKLLNQLLYVTILSISIVSCKKGASSTTDYAEVSSCLANPSWFPHVQTPAPEEGKGSPFDTTSTTNCMFHQWSWQKFLWLTKPESNKLPLFLNKLEQVTDAMIPVTVPSDVNVVLQDVEQAGSNGILKSNGAYAGNDEIVNDPTVYYSIHTNPTMLTAANTFEQGIKNKTIPTNNTLTFPIGSLELKVSWIDANCIIAGKLPNYFTTMANVSSDNGKTFTKKRVALLGMHVVGVVINHPEFIWATFEHNDLGPDFDWGKNQANSNTEQLLYKKGSTSSINGIYWDTVTNKPAEAARAYHLFEFGVPKTTSNEFMKTSQAEPENYDNIKSINASVLAKLNDVWKNYAYHGSAWINTDGLTPQQQADTIVKLSQNIANATPGSILRGCTNNANITMETYTQTFGNSLTGINATNLANCFSCHNSESFSKGNPNSPLYISHLFDAYVQYKQGKTRTQINTLKDSHQAVTLKKLSKAKTK